MPRSRTPSRGRVAAAKKSPSRARSRSRSRGRPAGASPGRSPGRVSARLAKSPGRRPQPAPSVVSAPSAVTASVREAAPPTLMARSPIRVTRSRSPARVLAPPIELRDLPKKVTPPPAPDVVDAPAAAPVAAPAPAPPAAPVPDAVTAPVMLTSTPKPEVRARRSLSRQAPEEAAPPAEPPTTVPSVPPAIGTRHSARIANKLRELGIEPSAGGDSNTNTTTTKEANNVENHVATKRILNSVSWARALATPLVLLTAALPFYLYSACNRKVCSIGRLPEVPRSALAYLDPVSLLSVPGWLLLHLLMAKLPVGTVAEGQISKLGLQRYRCNGLLTLFLTLGGAALAFYLGCPVFAPLRLLRLLLVSSAVWALAISLLLHLRSRRAHLLDLNPAGDTDSCLVNIVSGRELSPRLWGVDLKLLLVRSSSAALALLTVLYVLHERQSGRSSPTLLAAAGMILVAVLDRAWFEDNLLTTHGFMNEGLGLDMLLQGMVAPFLVLFNLRFITVTGVSRPWYAILGCALLFAIGYLIQRSSNSQKNEFRKNPVNPALAHLETIPTTRGKKLLVSGWWAMVRHPNHLGGLLMATALTLLLGFQHALAWVQLPVLAVDRVLHVRRLDHHCQHKYGAAWQRYQDRVRRSLVPGIY